MKHSPDCVWIGKRDFRFWCCFVQSGRKKHLLGCGLCTSVLACLRSKENRGSAAVFEINNPSSCLSTISERKSYPVLNWVLSCCNLSLLPLFREWNYNSLSLKFTGAPFLSKTRSWLLELEFSLHLCLPVRLSVSDSPKPCISFNELVQNRFLCYLRKQFPSVHILLKSNGFLFKKKGGGVRSNSSLLPPLKYRISDPLRPNII